MYDFEAILAPFGKHPTVDLIYFLRHVPLSVTINHILRGELVCLVDENQEHLIERFFKVLTEKHEVIVANALNHYPHLSDFQIFPGKMKNNGSSRLISSL